MLWDALCDAPDCLEFNAIKEYNMDDRGEKLKQELASCFKKIYDGKEPCPAGNEIYKRILTNLKMRFKEIPTNVYNMVFYENDVKRL